MVQGPSYKWLVKISQIACNRVKQDKTELDHIQHMLYELIGKITKIYIQLYFYFKIDDFPVFSSCGISNPNGVETDNTNSVNVFERGE